MSSSISLYNNFNIPNPVQLNQHIFIVLQRTAQAGPAAGGAFVARQLRLLPQLVCEPCAGGGSAAGLQLDLPGPVLAGSG